MIRRLVVAAIAVLVASPVLPANAAPVKLYLNQSGSCADGPIWTISTVAEDSGGCVYIPREQVGGQGVTSTNESFGTTKKTKTYKLDTKKPLTGTFALFGSSGLTLAEGPAVVTADFVIKVAKTKVGTVRVSGQAVPGVPVTKAFSFNLPASLKNVKTNSVQVAVTWVDCVGLCGVKVSGASFLDLPTK